MGRLLLNLNLGALLALLKNLSCYLVAPVWCRLIIECLGMRMGFDGGWKKVSMGVVAREIDLVASTE